MTVQGWNLEHSFQQLPDVFFQQTHPEIPPAPEMVVVDASLGKELGIEWERDDKQDLAKTLSGANLPPGGQPIAQAYAGHQFGGFTMLGDGRAILLGEQRTPSDLLFDIQLKGSGRTRYSRNGDGRAALGPMLREYLISVAMHGLGIPTSRSLAVVKTGETVYRQRPLPGAVLVRIAASHVRVGTFQFAAMQSDITILKSLADYVVQRHSLASPTSTTPYLELLENVIDRQAQLVAQWQSVAFIHGVLNTDNVSISGQTIDYGPCAFMDHYDPNTVFSSIDQQGRYAYQNQPKVTQWNLARFAETLLPLLDESSEAAIEIATAALHDFPRRYNAHWLDLFRRKLGLSEAQDEDESLIQQLLDWMETEKQDFTNTFLALGQSDSQWPPVFLAPSFQQWHQLWLQRLQKEGTSQARAQEIMQLSNPRVIPRNHQVERALLEAEQGSLETFQTLVGILERPFDQLPDSHLLQEPAPLGTCYQTFCGT